MRTVGLHVFCVAFGVGLKTSPDSEPSSTGGRVTMTTESSVNTCA